MNIAKSFPEVLSEELAGRRIYEEKIRKIFESWGYQEIETPTLEYLDCLVPGMGLELKKKLFKFLDTEGEIVVLRPDMTTPIARVTATKLASRGEGIYKFYYLNNVFRKKTNKTEEQQEFRQAGIELFGVNNSLADAEVIAVAIEALCSTGLQDFYLDIGSAKFFNSVMQQLPLKSEQRRILRSTIMNKDFVQMEKLLEQYNLSPEQQKTILQLYHWRGDYSIIQEAEKIFGPSNFTARQALQEIKEIYNYLKILGMERFILVDLGIIRNFDYYSGIVFEGYTDYTGSAICGGGRYDFLCGKFGKDIPSTGVAISIEELMKVLTYKQNNNKELWDSNKYYIRYKKGYLGLAYKLAEKLRKDNKIAEIELQTEYSKEEILKYVKNKRIRFLVDINFEDLTKVTQYDFLTKTEKRVSYE